MFKSSTFGRHAIAWLTALGAGALLMLSLASIAHAKEEYELNDSRETAYGPLQGDKWYTAEIETENDSDWYYFYVKSYSQMEFSATMVKVPGCNAYFYLLDKDGKSVRYESIFHAGYLDVVEHYSLTMTPGRYYIRAEACDPGDRYKFKIDPAGSLTTNRACGEAIVALDTVTPLLTEASADLGDTAGSLAAANAAVRESKGELAKLKRRWGKAQARWRKMKRRIKAHPEAPRFQRKERRRLRRSRARLNRTLAVSKRAARSELAAASETRAEVLAQRAPLQVLVTQHTNEKAQAEAQIAASC